MTDRQDDLAKMAQGALSVASGLAEEMRAMARAGSEALTARMELVRREEFDALREVAIRAAEQVAALEARLGALEARAAAEDGAAQQLAAGGGGRPGGEGAN
ncbi:MAG: accessory factor UbiK family protein [Acetobacteraceae bacterium]|nr:accessory factor UbiK family protein [Acetobacteraceae bacterium]